MVVHGISRRQLSQSLGWLAVWVVVLLWRLVSALIYRRKAQAALFWGESRCDGERVVTLRM